MNDGRGNFTRAMDALPDVRENGSTVVAGDFTGDGTEDVLARPIDHVALAARRFLATAALTAVAVTVASPSPTAETTAHPPPLIADGLRVAASRGRFF